ncbi:MAG: hypothetical protein ACOYT8_00805 [Candidatus Dependentiae bacterium]
MKKTLLVISCIFAFPLNAMWADPYLFTIAGELYKWQTEYKDQQKPDELPEIEKKPMVIDLTHSDELVIHINK